VKLLKKSSAMAIFMEVDVNIDQFEIKYEKAVLLKRDGFFFSLK
jgi:hypothetical protein